MITTWKIVETRETLEKEYTITLHAFFGDVRRYGSYLVIAASDAPELRDLPIGTSLTLDMRPVFQDPPARTEDAPLETVTV